MAETIKRLILGQLPIQACNLKCPYCYISQREGWVRDDHAFRYSVEHMVRCLSRERLGGVSLINLTAQGETFLYKDLKDLTKGLLEQGHYVEIVTNGIVTKRLKELLDLPDSLIERLFFKVSYHYSELMRTGLFDRFVENIDLIKDSPASFTLELMPFDGIEEEIDEIVRVTKERFGAVCHATVGRNESIPSYPLLTNKTEEQYVDTWSKLNSDMFSFKMGLYAEKRKEFCYAGSWSLFVDMATGEARQCYKVPNNQNIFANPEKPIMFNPIGHHCPDAYCYNGHSHMAFGLIPKYSDVTYFTIRNRVMENGENWVKEPCAEFFKHKLDEANKEYSVSEQARADAWWYVRYAKTLLRAAKRRVFKASR